MLINRVDILIKPADNGGAVVVVVELPQAPEVDPQKR